ncbi:hypothetical protein [Acinetobacter pullicarnis]|nr:hypothetical protein [Acinetobacter pullicarnis]
MDSMKKKNKASFVFFILVLYSIIGAGLSYFVIQYLL